MDTLSSAALLGLLLGLQHATDPDHLVAVGTLATRERRTRAIALLGVAWGLGHALALGLASAAVVATGLAVPPAAARAVDLAVAGLLIALGLWRLRDALGAFGGTPVAHLVAAHAGDHAHGTRELVHSHAHVHAGGIHDHPHVHPSRGLVAALGRGRLLAMAGQALAVGAMHGLSGSAALSLVLVTAVSAPGAAVVYVGVFGLATLAGMAGLTAALAWPLEKAARVDGARRLVGAAAGLAAIAVGLTYGAGALL